MVEDHHLHLPVHSNFNSNPNQNHCSMVVIRHAYDGTTDGCVFPPSNHENLQILPHSQHRNENPTIPQSASPSSSSTFSPSDSDTWGLPLSTPFDSQVGKCCGFVRCTIIGLELMRSKLSAVVSYFRNGASRRGVFWSIWVPAAAVVMACWIAMRRRKKRRRWGPTENEACLLDVIKEQDEKIAQLLHQIAQMNEILIDRHKALAAKVAK